MAKKVNAGDPFKFPASFFNDLVEMRQLWKAGLLSIGVTGIRDIPDADIIQAKNTTEATIARFGVMGISGVIISPTDRLNQFKERPALTGTTPTTAGHASKFMVAQIPIRAGKTGPAIVSGTTIVQVNIVDADHEFADVKDSDATQLESANTGAASILYKPTGTGSKWCVVRIGNGSPGGCVWMIKAQVNGLGTGEAGGVAAVDATFDVDNVTIVQPDKNASYPNATTPTEFNNSLAGALDNDAYVYAVYNVTTELWDTIAGSCPV